MSRLLLILMTAFVSWLGIWSARTNPSVGTLGDRSTTSGSNRSSGVYYRGGYTNGVWVSTSPRGTASGFSGRGPRSGVK